MGQVFAIFIKIRVAVLYDMEHNVKGVPWGCAIWILPILKGQFWIKATSSWKASLTTSAHFCMP